MATRTALRLLAAGSFLLVVSAEDWVAEVEAHSISAGEFPADKTFLGGFIAGRFGYFVPWSHTILGRVSLDTFEVQTLVLHNTGFHDGFSDGTYGYLVPRNHGDLVRFELESFNAYEILNLAASNVDSKQFIGGFIHNGYGYFVPYAYTTLARVDLNTFAAAGIETSDLALTDSTLTKFHRGFVVGEHGYLVPYECTKLVRFAFNDFHQTVDTLEVGNGFVAGFADEAHGYLVPFEFGGVCLGKLVRFDLQSFMEVVHLDLESVDSDLKGFDGGLVHGAHGYVFTKKPSQSRYYGKVARFSLQDFDINTVEVLDVTAIDPACAGFSGIFSDGMYGYLLPFQTSTKFTRFSLPALPTTTSTASTTTAAPAEASSPVPGMCVPLTEKQLQNLARRGLKPSRGTCR